MTVKKFLFGFLLVVVPLSLGILFAQLIKPGSGSLEGVSATVLSEARALPAFMLEDHLGQKFTNNSLKGHCTFMFFGYTHCPDICPTTLSTLNQVHETLQKQFTGSRPKTVFISVDPARDSKDVLADYISYFNTEFIGVSGSLQQLQALTVPLGIAFGKDGEGNDYEVFHSARILLIDPEGRLKALFSSPHDINKIASDYIRIIDS